MNSVKLKKTRGVRIRVLLAGQTTKSFEVSGMAGVRIMQANVVRNWAALMSVCGLPQLSILGYSARHSRVWYEWFLTCPHFALPQFYSVESTDG